MSNDFRPAEPERTFRPMTEADLVDLPKGVWVKCGDKEVKTTGAQTTYGAPRIGELVISDPKYWSIDSTYQPKAVEVKVGQRRRYSSELPPKATRHLVGEVFTIQADGVIAPTDFRILWEGGDVTVWTEKQILKHSTLLPSTDATEKQHQPLPAACGKCGGVMKYILQIDAYRCDPCRRTVALIDGADPVKDEPERPYKPVPALKPHYGPMNLSNFEKLPPDFDKLLAKQSGRHFPVPRIDEPLSSRSVR